MRWMTTLLEICLLRAGPQALPASTSVLALCLLGYGVVDLAAAASSTGLGTAAGVTLFDLAMMVVFVRLLLRLGRRPQRWLQTLSAMAGSGALLGLLALPPLYRLSRVASPADLSAGMNLFWIALFVWGLVVLGHILRHALSARFHTGLGLAILYSFLNIYLAQLWFTPAGT